jgi:hypothetical protein
MGTTVIVITGGAAVLVAGAFVAWTRLRGTPEEPTYHFRCPGCKRRLRYRARQVGHKGACSNCNRTLVFPPVSQAVE